MDYVWTTSPPPTPITTAKQYKNDNILLVLCITWYVLRGRRVMSAQNVGGVSTGVGMVLRLEKGAWSSND